MYLHYTYYCHSTLTLLLGVHLHSWEVNLMILRANTAAFMQLSTYRSLAAELSSVSGRRKMTPPNQKRLKGFHVNWRLGKLLNSVIIQTYDEERERERERAWLCMIAYSDTWKERDEWQMLQNLWN